MPREARQRALMGEVAVPCERPEVARVDSGDWGEEEGGEEGVALSGQGGADVDDIQRLLSADRPQEQHARARQQFA